MDENPYGLGAKKSVTDIRTFTYSPVPAPVKGGKRYQPEDIEHQHKVGICTAISLTQNARKALGRKFSADFQYLLQKREYDKNWDEGSSILNALKVANNFGLLPVEHFTHIKEEDRKLPYYKYVEKLKKIPDTEIERLKVLASQFKIPAYAKITISRDSLANAIDESDAGILARFEVGKEWWKEPIEPLRNPAVVESGHAITECNYDGGSFRVANTWGDSWADRGTAFHLFSNYRPTEAWMVYYNHVPVHVEDEIKKRETLLAKLVDALQKLLTALQKKHA